MDLNLIKYITFYKVLNIIRLYLFFILKKLNFRIKKLPNPYFLTIEPTNFCNLNCVACPSGQGELTRKQGVMPLNLFEKIIDENKKSLILIILHFQGEPFLNKNLAEMLNYAHKNNIYTMFSTNAQLTDTQLNNINMYLPNRLIISLDGLTQTSYEKYRKNGDILKVYNTLSILSQLKTSKKLYLELQFLVFKHNENEIKQLKKLKKEYNIDKITIKTSQIYNFNDISLLPEKQKYSRYIVNNQGVVLKKRIKNACKRLIFGNAITWNGDYVPCCFDKNADFVFGNIAKQPLNTARNTEIYNNFVENIFKNRKEITICLNCTE